MYAAHARRVSLACSTGLVALSVTALVPCTIAQSFTGSAPVPGYVPPVTQEQAPDYVDDTRGVFVPTHPQQRLKTTAELSQYGLKTVADAEQPLYAQRQPDRRTYEHQLNRVSDGVGNTSNELERIARDPGLLSGGRASPDAGLYNDGGRMMGVSADLDGVQVAQNYRQPSSSGVNTNQFPSLATGGQARVPAGGYGDIGNGSRASGMGDGQEIAIGNGGGQSAAAVDMQNSIVRLREERVSVRRALQRMMDQIGAGNWTIVWDLDEQNAGLPDMEISISAEEPFMNVLNALLGRLQSRSGQPLRVVRYDKTQRLVITDRTGSEPRSSASTRGGATSGTDVAVTETVLKETLVSLHYDEIPLVDALENVVNQAGKGQWRLRMYAGTDQVIKPAHIEEPFGVAVERILKIFNLRYEIFPGGKLIVVTSGDRFGFRGVE